MMIPRTIQAVWQPEEQYISGQIGAANSQRISRLVPIFLLIHVVHVVVFWPFTPGAVDPAQVWRNGVIAIHATMFLVLGVFWVAKALLERERRLPETALGTVSALVALFYLSGGAALTVVDQLVTSGIHALLLASVGVAMAITVRPAVAALNYMVVLAFFVTGVTWTQAETNLLLTIRVNGISAVGLGFGLALLQWRNHVRTIGQQRQIEEQQRELEEKNRELTLLATRDVLTGLLNRAQFLLEANRLVSPTDRTGSSACLIMLDIDHFKQINDTYGHPTGDHLLVGLATMMARTLRTGDFLARFGGEEFAILLPDTALPEGLKTAERLRQAIEQFSFQIGNRPVRVTASLGVAPLRPERNDAFNACYRAADNALYQAKNDGRNCVRFAPQ